MLTEPEIVERPAQFCAAIKVYATMQSISANVDRAFPELFNWLDAHGVSLTGAPYIKYNSFSADGKLELEIGAPVPPGTAGEGSVGAAILPAGRYATLSYFGGFDGLMDANAALQDWAKSQGLDFDVDGDEEGGRWAARLEIYHTDPRSEPDKSKWKTEIAYKIAR